VDDLGGRYSITIPIVSAATDFHLAGGKAAFGKYATRANALDLAEDWDLIWKNATLDDVVAEQSDFENGYYRKWASRRCEMFLSFTAATGSDITVALPFAVTNGIVVGTASAGYITNTSLYGTELTFAVAGTENTENITVMLCIMGTY